MGAEFSTPVRRGPTPGTQGTVFCILLCPYDKIRILHAPKEVEDLVIREERIFCCVGRIHNYTMYFALGKDNLELDHLVA